MNRKTLLIGCLALAVLAIVPDTMFASSIGGEDQLNELAGGLEGFLFGAPIKIAAFAGAAYGCVMGLVQHAYMKAITGVGFGIFAVKVPAIINSIYGESIISTITISQILGQ